MVLKRNAIRGRTAATIAESVEQAIHRGQFRLGEALPPVRDLASTLGVSPVTVAAAYGQLRTRGLLVASGRRGTRVAAGPPTPSVRQRVGEAPSDLRDLATGNPDPALLPPLDVALHALDGEPRLYGQPAEWRPLLTFLGGEFAADGLETDAVTVVGGALDGVERVMREHLRPGDLVAVEDPCFPAVLDLLAADGLGSVPFEVDDDGPDPASFASAIARAKAVIVTPRAQNPYGARLIEPRAAELRALLRRRADLLLIENDPLGPVSGAPAVTLVRPGAGRWAVVRSTSKFLGPDLRLAAIAGDELTIARVEGRQALGTRWVSTLLQRLALALWSAPSSGRLFARAAETYAHRREALLAALRERSITAHGRSGFNIWLPVKEEAPVVRGLAERGWAVMAGERFRVRTGPAIRITSAALGPDEAPALAADIQAVLAPASRFS
jgi:DNA-binding transcriptional MocR family regulator